MRVSSQTGHKFTKTVRLLWAHNLNTSLSSIVHKLEQWVLSTYHAHTLFTTPDGLTADNIRNS